MIFSAPTVLKPLTHQNAHFYLYWIGYKTFDKLY